MIYKISVIIPTYNRASTIKEALNSVLNQTYSDWECIIIDDGSTDHTETVIMDYINLDNRFIYIKRPFSRKKGAAACRNIGLEMAIGNYIQFLDSDDVIASNKFEIQINCLKKEDLRTIGTCRYGIMRPSWKNPKIFYGLNSFRSFKNPIKLFKIFALNFNYLPLHVYLIPAEIVKNVGEWNEKLTVNDDGEYFSRIILNSSKIKFCNNTYVLYNTGAKDRISGYVTKEKGVQSYIKSWDLIEGNIHKKIGVKNHIYVRGAKANLFKRLKSENPALILKYSSFFKDRWPNPSYFLISLINKVRTKLLVSSKDY